MSSFTNPIFLSVVFTHFVVDVFNGERSVLFAYLSEQLGFTNSQLGFYSMVFVLVSSIVQPVFGYYADRMGTRWMVSGGVFWMGIFFTLGILIPGLPGLWIIVVASLGSGAFHPSGTKHATLLGQQNNQGKETTFAAWFFLFGQVGLFIGPLVTGMILDRSGVFGLLWMNILALPAGFYAAWALRKPSPQAESKPKQKEESSKPILSVPRWAFVSFALLAAFQAWAQQNMMTFLPKYFNDLGLAPDSYGFLAAVFMGGSAVGGVLGGNLADRFGGRRIISITLALATLPLTAIAFIGWSPWLYLLIPLAGAFSGGAHSIIVVLAQRIIPGGMAMTSGLILGFMFASGAVGTLVAGYIADMWGFPMMFLFTGGLVLVAGILTVSLRKLPKV